MPRRRWASCWRGPRITAMRRIGWPNIVARRGAIGRSRISHRLRRRQPAERDKQHLPGGQRGADKGHPRSNQHGCLAGRKGGNKNKQINLRVVRIIPEENLLLLKGSVPGAKGSYLIIEK